MNPWFCLLLAGMAEVGFTYFLKMSEGLTRIWPTFGFILMAGLSFTLMTKAMAHLPLSTVYAVWCGVGIAGTALMSMLLLGETVTLLKAACLLLLVISVVGLKVLA
ncbi:hypothetical protein WH50_04890 [Pokkaliibacter plantistimulans]|uniref:Guanidinium exporter n=2 Tax=Pseudomonadota TaxID=1224 RepID=A0ABX5M0H9_9GAMM|nr:MULTISPECIES: SMR family transporter [Pokkaliibacter]MDH2431342.1 SMR family transporter [Pokkaliibacter sp. MBI-7]PPC78481.1 QacE family quaternary ammonium compound efflux SMR transporter [Pokkaliibacter plantistimulans]PXF32427.1 hypothetical protein WH50_04890 [Pokkaliibacter plantistimulans]